MTVDYDVTRIFSGLPRKEEAPPKAGAPEKKHRGSPAGALTALLTIYVCSLCLIYAAVGSGGSAAHGGFSILLSQGSTEDAVGATPEGEEITPPAADAAALTEEYNRTVQDAVNAYIHRIEADLADAERTMSGEAPVFLTDDRVLPVFGEITSGFSRRENPFYTAENGEERYEFHTGVDIAAKTGTPVFAYTDGIVIDASVSKSYGNYVILSHGAYDTLYAHLDTMIVDEGDRVTAGDKIAFSGNTGRSTAPHLHFEVRAGGEAIDPLSYLS